MRRLLSLVCFSLFAFVLVAAARPIYSQSDCPATRLTINGQARVTPGAPNRVRDAANTNGALVGEIPGSAIFDVLDGPFCDGGLLWWQVDYQGLVGYTAEGNASGYFVEPYSADATAAPVVLSDDCSEPTLAIGRQGLLISDPPNRVRNAPSTDAEQVGQINENEPFEITDGPLCTNGILWWQVYVFNTGLEGWTAESVDGTVLLELIALTPTPQFTAVPLIIPQALAWNADGTQLAIGAYDGVYLVDTANFSATPRWILRDNIVRTVVYHPTEPDTLIVNVVDDDGAGIALVWDTATDSEIIALATDHYDVLFDRNSLSADGDLLILIKQEQLVVKLYQPLTGRLVGEHAPSIDDRELYLTHVIPAPQTTASTGVVSGYYADGVYLFSSDFDFAEPIIQLDRETVFDNIKSIAFSPDGQRVIIGDDYANLQMWDIETQERTSFIRSKTQRSTSSNQVNAIAFSPDGEVVVTAESDPLGIVRVFDALTLQTITAWSNSDKTLGVYDVMFSPDGTQLAMLTATNLGYSNVMILDTSDYSLLTTVNLERE
ncbi:MAG: SH3 domain-containing protein [Armatimonadetes bacterium]|nr:SH3 domain-containing protein [Anaerolineae bacterium]